MRRQVLALLPRLRRAWARFTPGSRHRALAAGDLDRDIVIVGYYGAGNLGDDVLATYVLDRVCRTIDPRRILVGAPRRSYLERWYPGIRCMPLEDFCAAAPAAPRKLLFGGGGVFHGFGEGDASDLWGLTSSTVYGQWLAYGGRNWALARKYAFCVGVGPLDGKGARWILGELMRSFEHISVRDHASAEQLDQLAIPRVILATDPSLAMQDLVSTAQPPRRQRLAIVVREWRHAPGIDGLTARLHVTAKALRDRGWNVEFVSFQAEEGGIGGPGVFRTLRERGETVREWKPERETIRSFCEYLQSFAVMLSMRAHGVFLARLLGCMPVAVLIEPKLALAAQICGHSDLAVPLEASATRIQAAVEQAMARCQPQTPVGGLESLAEEERRLIEWLRDD